MLFDYIMFITQISNVFKIHAFKTAPRDELHVFRVVAVWIFGELIKGILL